ncbi:MAG: hypothetical protein V3V02_10620 [Rhizobiaceae bacterium]
MYLPLSCPNRLFITSLTAALLCSASSAYALEGKALLDKMMKTHMGKADITWKSISEDSADSFTIQGALIKSPEGKTSSIEFIVVRGLKENDDSTISFDAITMNNLRGEKTDDNGNFALKSISMSGASLPTFIFQGDLTDEQKKARVKFDGFVMNGLALKDEDKLSMTMDTFSMGFADIPLDFRYEKLGKDQGPAAPALTMKSFGVYNVKGSQGGISWGMGSFTVADINVPTALTVPMTDWMKLYSAMTITKITTSMADKEVFAMESLSGSIGKADADGTQTYASSMEGMMVNLEAIPDEDTQKFVTELGYKTIEGSMTGTGTYNLKLGRITVSDMVLKLKDMLDISMAYAITGYTADVAQKFNEAQLEIAGGKEPMGVYMSMLPELSKIKLEGLKLAITDHSLTGKILDYQGSQMGTTGDQLAQGAPMMLGMGMAGLNMPAFTEMVTKAIGTFLKEKGTLSIEAKPSEPVSIMEVVISGQTDPTKVPELLNLQVVGK